MSGKGNDAKPIFLAGIWSGQRVIENISTNISWTLALSPSSKYPSSFGASLVNGDKLTSLHGSWNPSLMQITLTEITKPHSSYKGTLSKRTTENKEEIWIISGIWKCALQEGTFLICKEPEDEKTHISGVWLGSALPDESLADFFFPINPIRWCLTILVDNDGNPNSIFGSGYLDDTADIPGQPVIFYTLSGNIRKTDSGISFSLVKVYEDAIQTSGYELEYSGSLTSGDNQEYWLKGNWKNPKGGSFGQFLCKKQPASTNLTSHLCVCEMCNRCIEPGETRWSCSECALSWNCCENCHFFLPITHEHDLSPEIIMQMETASGDSTASLVCDSFTCFSARPFLYFHPSRDSNSIVCASYNDVRQMCGLFLSGMNIVCPVEKGNRPVVAFCADMSPSYVIVMLACAIRGYIIVPIHASLDEDSIGRIFERAKPNFCFFDESRRHLVSSISSSSVSKWIKLTKLTFPFEPLGTTMQDPMSSEDKIFNLNKILSLGSQENAKGLISYEWIARLNRDDVVAVLFTSGSTGTPKGAMFTEELVFPTEGTTTVLPYIRMDFQLFDPSFILSIVSTMQCGGSRALSSPENLISDFLSIRPTHMGATPVFWNNLFQEFLINVNKSLQVNKHKTIEEIEIEISQEMRRKLGNRLFVATSGGAPISPQVLKFAKHHLAVDIIDLYGSRECGGITRDGVVYPGIDIHLLSLPDLGYFNTSNPPQGEICVRSPRMIPGYWNDEKLSSEMFVYIGGVKYYRTGDVGEMIVDGNHRRLTVIGRSSFVFKLAQGEWIAPAKIETLLEQCPWVEQSVVLGDSKHSFTVAVIVPSKLLFAGMFKDLNKNSDSALIDAAIQKIRNEIRFWCSHNHLRIIETPQAVALEFEAWNPENGFLTSTLKKKRSALLVKYSGAVEKLYEGYKNDGMREERAGLSEAFREILAELFASDIRATRNTMFAELGDSLVAVKFVKLLKDRNVRLTNQSVFEYSFGHLSDLLALDEHSSVSPVPQSCPINWSNEWNLDSYITTTESEKFERKAETMQNKATGVLLTGCTGFLGPILLSKILIGFPNSKIFCLVRNSSQNQVFSLMKKAKVWQPEFESRIQLLFGDLSQNNLGLSIEEWEKLGKSIAQIFHSGAWVNVSLPYSTLKATNVLSSISLIKLSLKYNIQMNYISSISALGSPPLEDFTNLSSWDMSAKSGYAQSKVVSEKLLQQALFGSSFGLGWLPADFVSAAIVKLAQLDDISVPVFHLCGDSPSFEQVLKLLRQRKFILRDVSPEEWKTEVLALPDSHLASPLRGTLQNLDWKATPILTPIVNTKTVLDTQTDLQWPTITNNLIERYFDYFFDECKERLISFGVNL